MLDSEDECVNFQACNYTSNPTEPCQFLDVLGVCGGGCEADSDGDGICDDLDFCVGVLDECGVCNGPGPLNAIVEAITATYDSLYLPLDDEWLVYAVDADTTFAFECPPVIDDCYYPAEEISGYSLTVEASAPVNPANGVVYRFFVNAVDSTDTFSAVFGNDMAPLHISTPEGIYNSEINNSWNTSGLSAAILSFFPEAQDDSFATIGLDLETELADSQYPSVVEDVNDPTRISEYFTQGGTVLLNNTLIGGSWYIVGPTSNAFPVDGRWLIAQITTTGTISGQINFQIFPFGNGNDQQQVSVEFFGCGTFDSTYVSDAIEGCTDEAACNYNGAATEENGSCLPFDECGGCGLGPLLCIGCTDETACNYLEGSTIDDGSCFAVEEPEAQIVVQSDIPVTFTAGPGSHWYETAESDVPITIAESYTMPFLTEDASVWVSNAEYDMLGGKLAPDFGNGNHHTNNVRGLTFDVFQSVLFESVEVYAAEAGNQVVEIFDNGDNLLHAVSQDVNPGLNVFVLNVELAAAEDYQIRSGNDVPLLWRDHDGADVHYPFELGSIATITGTTDVGTPNQFSYYYFFYNWKMSSTDPCLSPRVELKVDVE